jgi:nitroreductase
MPTSAIVRLPQPEFTGEVIVEQALLTRRSVRSFAQSALFLAELSQLLWAAQGSPAPAQSHRALRRGPLSARVHAGGPDAGLTAGVYRYRCREHPWFRPSRGDARELCRGRLWVSAAWKSTLVLLISAVYARMTATMANAACACDMEAGHAAQSISLQAVALGLGSVVWRIRRERRAPDRRPPRRCRI